MATGALVMRRAHALGRGRIITACDGAAIRHRVEHNRPDGQATINIGIDIDSTISAFPTECREMISAFTAAGHRVFILSGVEADEVTQEDYTHKLEYLTSMGISSDLYVELVVSPKPHDVEKAKQIEDKGIAMLFDNTKANVKKAAPLCACWLLWNAKK